MTAGYFTIGIYRNKTAENLGTLWRSAYQLGAAGVFTINHKYKKESTDSFHTMGKIPFWDYPDWEGFLANRPRGAQLVAVEMGGTPLSQFEHPQQAIYLLGSEDHGLPPKILAQCQHLVSLEAVHRPSYNVAVAGSLVMYDRVFGYGSKGSFST